MQTPAPSRGLHGGLSRRALLAGLGGLAALPAAAHPLAISEDAWLGYEARLGRRLQDAGGGRFQAATERELLALTNTARRAAGAASCGWNEELARVARAHAADLAGRGYVEHLSPEGFDPTHRVGLLARRMIGSASENIAFRRAGDPTSAAELMGIWRRSTPHWTNLLRPRHAQAGFGVVAKGERTYAVGLYARPDGALGAPLPFRLAGEGDLSSALRETSPHFESYALADPLDEAAARARLEGAAAGPLPPGVYQLRPRRRMDAGRYQVLWGPIFVRV
ncbi:CAP domain-containing protein [Phenylobacterium sp.]|uniref:CAP domain-containing protein n=1 Tax=Phenylobacterium sp. TaxID=1871053 RepID=UPI00289D0E11|nr:CAP domain-containing protein [Phenylobacterium sp.]